MKIENWKLKIMSLATFDQTIKTALFILSISNDI